MRPVLAILGLAIVAVVFSIAISSVGPHQRRAGEMTPRPQDREDEKREKEQQEIRSNPKGAATSDIDEPFNPPKEGMITAVMTVQGRGDVIIELYPKAAPQTVSHFTSLIKNKFYDGILFHRVIRTFVAQTGDPESKKVKPEEIANKSEEEVGAMGLGSHGSGTNVPFETNDLKHVKGTVAMALSAAKSDTGDSQFFINLSPNHALDGNYCVFGKVTPASMAVVNSIKQGDRIQQFVVK